MTQRARYLVVTTLVAAILVTVGPGVAQASPAPDDPRKPIRGTHHHPPSSYVTQVGVGVPGIDERGIVDLVGGVVPVQVVNQRLHPVNFRLAVDVQAHGRNSRSDQGDHTLAPSGVTRFSVPVASLGITPDRLEGPAVLTLRATTHADDGSEVDGVVSPSLYLSMDRRRGLVLYNEERLLKDYDGGTVNVGPGAAPTRGGSSPTAPGTINLFAGEGPGGFDPDADIDVLGSGLHTVCVHWQYGSSDHNAGERYYTKGEPMAARGVKLAVVQGNKLFTPFYANEKTGCASLALESGVPAQVTIFAEARIGTNRNLTVRAYESYDLWNTKNSTKIPDQNLRKWSYYLLPGSNPSHLYVPADVSSTMMALGSFSVHRLDREAPVTQTRTLDFMHTSEHGNSYAHPMFVNIDTTQIDRKFVYGHEVGHWYQGQQGFDLDNTYQYASTVPACTSTGQDGPLNLWHLMRSTEFNSDAFDEGLGHFFSTVVWNGTGWKQPMFRYYKNMASYAGDKDYGVLAEVYQDLWDTGDDDVDDNLIDMAAATAAPLGGTRNWRDNVCGDEDLVPNSVSVELDWARFLVNYLDGNLWWDDLDNLGSPNPNIGDLSNGPGASSPTFAQLIDHLRYAYEHFYVPAENVNSAQANADVYLYFVQALKAPELGQQAFAARFELLAERYGVDK